MHLYMSWLFCRLAPGITTPCLSQCDSFCCSYDKCHLVLLMCSQNIITARIFSLNPWLCRLTLSAYPCSGSAVSGKGGVCLPPPQSPLPPPSLSTGRTWGDAWLATSHASQHFRCFFKVSCLWILRLQAVRRGTASLFCIRVTHGDTEMSPVSSCFGNIN